MPSQGQNGGFSISHSVRRFIESTVDPISKSSDPVSGSPLA